ncbi:MULTISPECIES: thioesterase family protein [Thalassospira]|uniref:Thioesterase n=1 Tax=Thalassospira profundimaris TaxID=502049 RepID=A0A367V2B6_9PROT|nr:MULTISPECIES: thioesterase family protein [Thalassospira]KZB69674.1 thioesterase [Thalassospira sp. MCCC 1A01148]MBR9900539.1 acyl-CoA thioesterase [Rhodospirillales bacterium]RCK19325.1 thioesterase [Thalassospira profundimaris]
MAAFTYQQKVLFQHCDPAGIVFYPRYFEMVNATVEEWFDQVIGCGFPTMHGPMKVAVPTAALSVAFTAPSKLGDVLEFTLIPTRIGRSSLELEITAQSGGEQRVKTTVTLVFTKHGAGKSVAWPDDLRAKIEKEINQVVENNA